jgi:8-oxo-dGTP pyrophosphatase MutT (NUDIX family)
MTIFISDLPVHIVSSLKKARITDETHFDAIIDNRLTLLKAEHLNGHILLLNVVPVTLNKVFTLLHESNLSNLQSITLIIADKTKVKEQLKSFYKIVKAAGGIVEKGNKILMIHRLEKWDLPKGKLDDGEKSKHAAVREVEEETGVEASLKERICTTYHTYTQNGRYILKCTKWYLMKCENDHKLAPQTEEDITQLAWMKEEEVRNALKNSYSSIRYVIDKYSLNAHKGLKPL